MGGAGIARGGLSSLFYMYFNGGRSVSSHFWPDYHLGGSRRGGLGGSDCITICSIGLIYKSILSFVNIQKKYVFILEISTHPMPRISFHHL